MCHMDRVLRTTYLTRKRDSTSGNGMDNGRNRPVTDSVGSRKRWLKSLQLIIGSVIIGFAALSFLAGMLGYFLSDQFDRELREQGISPMISSTGTFLMIAAIALCFVIIGAVIVASALWSGRQQGHTKQSGSSRNS